MEDQWKVTMSPILINLVNLTHTYFWKFIKIIYRSDWKDEYWGKNDLLQRFGGTIFKHKTNLKTNTKLSKQNKHRKILQTEKVISSNRVK